MPDFRRQIVAVVAALTVSAAWGGVGLAAEGAPPSQPGTMASPDERPRGHGLDARIRELHDKLHITDAQADEWKALAQVMRDNSEAMRKVVTERRRDADTLTAIGDLDMYRKVAETHLENVKRLSVAFTKLYNAMSDEQKRVADEVFRHRNRHGGPRPASMAPDAAR
ncbi:MAG: Spy/CpxP family protein refolding chaperone [Magnetospirillum sp.]|nr:Spy/CpxP family protein refolding chaperone [Magnetospirillum sp.]